MGRGAPRDAASGGPRVPAEERAALRAALAAEHAAVYAFGVVGGVLVDDPDASAAYAAHRGRRDQLTAMLGTAAVAAEPVYTLPFAVSGPAAAEQLAARVERRCADVYAGVVARTTGRARAYAARALTDCAVRGLSWGAQPEPFPGLRPRR
jgi:hypothetical protein